MPANQFLIAAPASGSGKTTVARALMALLRQRGLNVQPFKGGPDYIDPKFHTAVCGRASVNLDTFLASHEHVRRIYACYGAGADVCVVEGMMGLWDGYDRSRGSSAEIARLLGLPVVLVVDASHAAYSVAPLLKGFAQFDEGVHLQGVLFNKVGSVRHERLLRQAATDAGLTCLGCLPRRKGMEQPSRYLGLDFAQQLADEGWVQWIEDNVDVEALLSGTFPATADVSKGTDATRPADEAGAEGRILVARNADAFSFLYRVHLDVLAQVGTVTYFDPEQDTDIPADTQLVYLPGGYPELHAPALQTAEGTRRALRRYAEEGGRVLAECGGMMYLCERLLCDDGDYAMCGVLPYTVSARRADRRLALGYRQMVYNGLPLRGHEFHYTQFAGEAPLSATSVCDALGREVPSPLVRQGNVLASYTHLYWGELGNPLRLFA